MKMFKTVMMYGYNIYIMTKAKRSCFILSFCLYCLKLVLLLRVTLDVQNVSPGWQASGNLNADQTTVIHFTDFLGAICT
jgi:hypothetical protein